MGENDQSNDRHKRRSATLSTKGFSSAPGVAKAIEEFFYLVGRAYGARQAEHQQL